VDDLAVDPVHLGSLGHPEASPWSFAATIAVWPAQFSALEHPGGAGLDRSLITSPPLEERHVRRAMPTFRSEGLSLTVEDVDRSVAFYVGKLGLELAHLASPAFAMVRNCDGGLIGLLSAAEASTEGVAAASPAQRRGVHVEFTTDDLDGLYTELLAAGVEFAEPPHDEPWERAMTAYDPDGYSVEFGQGPRGSFTGTPTAAP